MVTIEFIETPAMRTWLHRPGGLTIGTYAGKPTTKIVGPDIMAKGDTRDVPKGDAAWLLGHYPRNFRVLEAEAEPEDELAQEE